MKKRAAAALDDRLALAYAYCERLAREHYENFPVASLLLPAAMRPHIAAVYAFARRADDFADEPGPDVPERLRLLDGWSARLSRGSNGHADEEHGSAPASGDDLIFRALENTIARHSLPRSLFHDLLSAFRQDVVTTRYATWADVLDYCRRSANPIGRLVLRIAGHDDARLDVQSDAVCTALQLTNFWQDLGVDWTRGRLYVPLDDRDRAGARDEDLDAGRFTTEWGAALLGREHEERVVEVGVASHYRVPPSTFLASGPSRMSSALERDLPPLRHRMARHISAGASAAPSVGRWCTTSKPAS